MVKKTIVGQRKKMNNGMIAEVIFDRGAFDIDIKFEDGTIVRKKSRAQFNRGGIANPSIGKNATRISNTSILGQTKTMLCGLKATVIADRGAYDIDIQFENGIIVSHTKRKIFRAGKVTFSNHDGLTGSINKMNCGFNAIVVADRGPNDIDVEFENGVIVTNKTRTAFKRGNISFPGAYKKSILGQNRTMSCGMCATVIDDNGWDDISVQFEDGTIVKGTSRSKFKKGTIANPSLGKGYALIRDASGETRIMNCGMEATVIAYRSSDDIDVLFVDGTMIKHRKIAHFRKGLIGNPNVNTSSIAGQQRVMNCGMLCEVIADRGCNDIDVRFADGTTLSHISRKHFQDGKLANPSLGRLHSITLKTSLAGQTRLMNCGMEATVICDRGAKDIDVRFTDGTIISSVRRGNFIRNKIDNPNYNKSSLLGQKKMMKNGQSAIVIEDRGWNDIDIQFEDGVIRKNLYRSSFITGYIANPTLPINSLPEMLIYNCVHQYYPHSERGFRPEWLMNPDTGANLELDIWIPELKIGIEYDGFPWHEKETSQSEVKYNLLKKSNQINYIITILERGTIVHTSDKHINFQLHYISRPDQYRLLLTELYDTMVDVFALININAYPNLIKKAIDDFT